MTALPIIIDCDPGIDDSVGILMALASPELDVLGITVVAGNVELERTLRNTLQVRELSGRREVPVLAGCHRPLVRKQLLGIYSGVKGLGPVTLPEPTTPLDPRHAVPFLVESLTGAARTGAKITLCTMGPLTNVAMALRHAPVVAEGIARIVMMGGAFRQAGNRTMSAEFNILADPHAAEIVLSSGLPIVCASLDASHQAMTTPDRVAAIRTLGGTVAGTVADLLTFWDRKDLKRFGSPGGPLHDPLVIAYLLRPSLFQCDRARVFVQHDSELTMGQTIADWWDKSGEPANVEIIAKVDADGYFALIRERLAAYA